MRAFVTGATGFVGYNLTVALLKRGYDVVALVRSREKARLLPEGVKTVEGDIIHPIDPSYLKGVDVVFHVAGLISSPYPEKYMKVNFGGTRNLIESILSLDSRSRPKLIFTSTIAAVGPGKGSKPIEEDDEPLPIDKYGESKRHAEEIIILLRRKINSVIIRPTAIYGFLDRGLLPIFRLVELFGFPVIRETIISVVHILDVVKAHILAAEKDVQSADIFHISDGKSYSMEDIYNILSSVSAEQYSKRIRKIILPRWFLIALYYILRLTPAFAIERAKMVSADTIIRAAQKNWYCTYKKAKEKLGFEPDFTASEGLKQTLIWYWRRTVAV